MDKLKISRGLHKVFKQESEDNSDKYAVLYLLGANRLGIIDNFMPIARDGGCEFMPRAHSSSVTKAYVELAKKKSKPVAFALVQSNLQVRTAWSPDHGSALYNTRMPFILYNKGRSVVRVVNRNNNRIVAGLTVVI